MLRRIFGGIPEVAVWIGEYLSDNWAHFVIGMWFGMRLAVAR
jgi:hypothetical protein